MRLYLDTEFNGHGGELISIALAASEGEDFYAEIDAKLLNLDPWVKEHVSPHLIGEGEPMRVLRRRLRAYLQDREECTIYADWPADFEHLMHLMCGPSYDESWMIRCELQLLSHSSPDPKTPHNALSDAQALRDWYESNFIS